ncbi:MAG TPA: heterodisulfide reductase-related iron-sulfur binding cluster, partial [Miltoncostaeaceae bacterium]|nr:heterodisulfide reductase-related iron-sulfur binding cluster [Miltoncostaeaceae bacterium]
MQLAAILISLLATAAAVAVVGRTAWHMVRVFRTGQPDDRRTGDPGARTRTMLLETLGHTRMLRWSVPGAAHWFVFVGFGVLFLTLVEAYAELFDPTFLLPVIGGTLLYGVVIELVAFLTLAGILTLIGIRIADHPSRPVRKSRFAGSNSWMAYYVEATIVGIAVAVFLIRSFRIADGHLQASPLFFVSYPLSLLWSGMSPETIETALVGAAAFKILVSMAWFAVIALNANMGIAWHRFTAFPNIWFKRNADGTTALGGLTPMYSGGKKIDFEDPGDEDLFGAGQVEHFTWKNMLDFATCTECGRCQSQCPAWNTGKPLSPKLLVMSLRDHQFAKAPYLLAGGGKDAAGEERATPEQLEGVPAAALGEAERPLVGTAEDGGVIDPDVLWSCTTCGACVEQCPVDIEHVDHIVDMRRYQVLIESAFPSEAGVMLKNLENKGNPWGMNDTARLEWTEGLPFEVRVVTDRIPDDVEYLFWVGCAGALEDRSKKTTRAFAELLHTAGVEFAILGPGESCTGDPARRLGNEFVFQMLAQQNVEVLDEAFGDRETKKIVATCPHCFNTLANEYGDLGGHYEVVHHTQLLGRLVEEGRLVPVTPVDEKVTYHDPCYLGRHNRVYTPPREVLASVPGLRTQEMHRCRERGFCCGAGGARMWMEEKIGKQINVERTEEALSLDPDVVGTACPFCMVMLSDAVTAKKQQGKAREEVQVLDVSQILARSLVAPPQPQPEPVGVAAGAGPSADGGGVSPAGGGGHDDVGVSLFSSVTPDVTVEGTRPVSDDPEETQTADYPQLAGRAPSTVTSGVTEENSETPTSSWPPCAVLTPPSAVLTPPPSADGPVPAATPTG